MESRPRKWLLIGMLLLLGLGAGVGRWRIDRGRADEARRVVTEDRGTGDAEESGGEARRLRQKRKPAEPKVVSGSYYPPDEFAEEEEKGRRLALSDPAAGMAWLVEYGEDNREGMAAASAFMETLMRVDVDRAIQLTAAVENPDTQQWFIRLASYELVNRDPALAWKVYREAPGGITTRLASWNLEHQGFKHGLTATWNDYVANVEDADPGFFLEKVGSKTATTAEIRWTLGMMDGITDDAVAASALNNVLSMIGSEDKSESLKDLTAFLASHPVADKYVPGYLEGADFKVSEGDLIGAAEWIGRVPKVHREGVIRHLKAALEKADEATRVEVTRKLEGL